MTDPPAPSVPAFAVMVPIMPLVTPPIPTVKSRSVATEFKTTVPPIPAPAPLTVIEPLIRRAAVGFVPVVPKSRVIPSAFPETVVAIARGSIVSAPAFRTVTEPPDVAPMVLIEVGPAILRGLPSSVCVRTTAPPLPVPPVAVRVGLTKLIVRAATFIFPPSTFPLTFILPRST